MSTTLGDDSIQPSFLDERIEIMNEIVTGMRVIKMYCWEIPFSKLVAKVRRNECVKIMRRGLAQVRNDGNPQVIFGKKKIRIQNQ